MAKNYRYRYNYLSEEGKIGEIGYRIGNGEILNSLYPQLFKLRVEEGFRRVQSDRLKFKFMAIIPMGDQDE